MTFSMKFGNCLVVLWLLLVATDAQISDNELEQSSILYGVMKEAALGGDLCATHAQSFLTAATNLDIWAIKAIDASGQSSNSFIWGNIRWLGSKANCGFLSTAPQIYESGKSKTNRDPSLISSTSPFPLDFRMIFANFTSKMFLDPVTYAKPIMQIGLCVPKTCNDDQLMNYADSYFYRNTLTPQKMFSIDVNVVKVRGTSMELFLQNEEVLWIVVCIALVFVFITFLSLINTVVNTKDDISKSAMNRFLKCFSISGNSRSLFLSQPKSDALASINGLRVVICLLVVALHITYYTWFTHGSFSTGVLLSYSNVEMQPIISGVLWTDGFFVISGLLLVYNFLRDEKKLQQIRDDSILQNLITFTKLSVHRYIRLFPIFVFVMAVTHLVGLYLRDASTVYIDDDYDFICPSPKWWRNLLVAQNFFEVKDTCVSWGWYLACDIQFYMVFLLGIIIYAKKKWVAYMIMLALSIGVPIYTYISFDIPMQCAVDTLRVHHYDLYVRPWFHVSPYFIGVFFGWLMSQLKDRKFTFNQYLANVMWLLALVSLFLCSFAAYKKFYEPQYYEDFAMPVGMTIIKPYFMVCIAFVILLCFLGNGDKVNRLFGRKVFVHLGKVTYTIYMIHPVIVILMYGSREVATTFDFMMILEYIGLVIVSYVLSIVCYVFIEIPLSNLSDEFILKRRTS